MPPKRGFGKSDRRAQTGLWTHQLLPGRLLGHGSRVSDGLDGLQRDEFVPSSVAASASGSEAFYHTFALGAWIGRQGRTKALQISVPPQKVGRTTKHRGSSRNHEPFLAHIGYETP